MFWILGVCWVVNGVDLLLWFLWLLDVGLFVCVLGLLYIDLCGLVWR